MLISIGMFESFFTFFTSKSQRGKKTCREQRSLFPTVRFMRRFKWQNHDKTSWSIYNRSVAPGAVGTVTRNRAKPLMELGA